MDYQKLSLEKHFEWKGKLEMTSRVRVDGKEALSLAYTPGVAAPCLAIKDNPELSYSLTRRWNTVAVVTDGSAVLGLGNIGPLAGMPVMEGKSVLFKEFADIDAIPICLDTQDVDEIVAVVKAIAPSFGGINLEDISAPRCFEVERRLKELCDIPVFHDDQHGTAIVLAAALKNALKLVKKDISTARLVINGAGSAGIAIAEFLILLGAKNIIVCDRLGIIDESERFNKAQNALASKTNPMKIKGDLADAVKGVDAFIGVSTKDVLSQDMVRSMAEGPIVFAMANPSPEIMPELALEAGAKVVATGRSDLPNQINNVLAFPGIFRGALDTRASSINEEMKIAASNALAALVSDGELNESYILPQAFDPRVAPAVAAAVAKAARESGAARI
ncbi:MAG: NAD-dependent malic enzyme [Clostridia bacterium]|jgi:malate dehydrogenase (oxaloacetate-decarboxylating)|nr:NAD-dependent malic enzyme [Clostridia bacterium]